MIVNRGQFRKGQASWNKGLKGYNAGVVRTAEWCQNITEGLKDYWDRIGRKSTANALLRRSAEFKEWRLAVFEKDNYACQICGENKRTNKRIALHPHHIESFAEHRELRFALENGQTLCGVCHGKIHNIDFNGYHRKLICAICGDIFKAPDGRYKQKTCSKKCGYTLRYSHGSGKKGKHYPHLQRARIANCLECGKEFRAVKDSIYVHQKYCSRGCYLKHRWNYTGKKAVSLPSS